MVTCHIFVICLNLTNEHMIYQSVKVLEGQLTVTSTQECGISQSSLLMVENASRIQWVFGPLKRCNLICNYLWAQSKTCTLENTRGLNQVADHNIFRCTQEVGD